MQEAGVGARSANRQHPEDVPLSRCLEVVILCVEEGP